MFQGTANDTQVFDEKLIRYEGAALPVQSVLDNACRVNVVEDGVSVALISGSEYDDIEVFAELLDQLLGIGTYVNKPVADFPLEGFEGHFNLIAWCHNFTGMN